MSPRRPFITLTYAQSLDGSICAEKGVPLLLSGNESLKMTHSLRARHEGICVGVGTVLADNPSLTTRLVPGPSPYPIIIDSNLRTPLECKLVRERRAIVACTALGMDDNSSKKAERRLQLLGAGAEVVICKATPSGTVDFEDLFYTQLGNRFASVMVEGGACIISAFLDDIVQKQRRATTSSTDDSDRHDQHADPDHVNDDASALRPARTPLVDQIVVTIAPVFVGGYRPLTVCAGAACQSGGEPRQPSCPRLVNVSYTRCGEDVVCRGDVSFFVK